MISTGRPLTIMATLEKAQSVMERLEVVDESGMGSVAVDTEAEKKLLRKCDLHVLPPLFVLFLLAFLDRTNIGTVLLPRLYIASTDSTGNAKIQGLTEDLDMKNTDYNIALFVFFIPYILFEIPSNLILKKLAPSTWLAAIMVLWGICTVGMGLVNNFEGLVAMRVLLGFFEAGLFPGQ
jgi:MFS family permease